MATIPGLVVQSVADYALDYHVRKGMLFQNVQDRPLLRWLEGGKKTFSGGKGLITEPVQGSGGSGSIGMMSDTAGFFAGFSGDTALTFTQMGLGDRAEYSWKEMHAGFVITFSQLKQDDIVVVDGEQRTVDASDTTITRLSGILEGAMRDYAESWARSQNSMYWDDGTQDSLQVPGIKALIVDDPTGGTVGGISQAANPWWRSRADLSLVPSAENQDLSRFLRKEVIQLQRYSSGPNSLFCGSDFLDALMLEVQAKGLYTQSGFTGNNDIGMQKVSIAGVGTFQYDPTLDDKGMAKRCYALSRDIQMRPMENAHNLTFAPARPYQYMVLIKSMVDTAALTARRLNASAVYSLT